MAKLDKALELANFVLKKYNPSKIRPVYTDRDRTSLTVARFTEVLVAGLKTNLKLFPEIVDAISDENKMVELLEEWAAEYQEQDAGASGVVPPELEGLTLNVDKSATRSSEQRYFCTTANELRSDKVSGSFYIERLFLSPKEAIAMARAVVPKYLPRKELGIHEVIDPTTKEEVKYHNSYVPPAWKLWQIDNPKEWNKLPSKCPSSLMTMIKHIIPYKQEREYFYAWLHTSLAARAYVFLVLQGIPGVGKNRLQVLFTALHGKVNSVNGKKETFGANGSKFNGQLFNSTLAWFDELKYDAEMEPRLKEYQNDTASKELKGVDATNSSEIHCSMVISNNWLKDNYIPFNARKFAPILLGPTALKYLMTEAEIDEVSNKLNESHPDFDVVYVAQVAKWILHIGPKYAEKFSRLEYKGPKFWELAHATMSRWQKVVVVALTTKKTARELPGWNEAKKAFQWTQVESALRRRKELSDRDYRDPSTVKAFFDNYRNTEGKQVFETKAFTGSILQDFWVWPIEGVDVTIQMNDIEELIEEEDPDKLVRPSGITTYQWNKLKEKHEQARKKIVETKDTDLL